MLAFYGLSEVDIYLVKPIVSGRLVKWAEKKEYSIYISAPWPLLGTLTLFRDAFYFILSQLNIEICFLLDCYLYL